MSTSEIKIVIKKIIWTQTTSLTGVKASSASYYFEQFAF